jgi:hypothetical protein
MSEGNWSSFSNILKLLALLFAIGSLVVGGIVLLSVDYVDALVIGLHEISLAIAVILLIIAAFIPTE